MQGFPQLADGPVDWRSESDKRLWISMLASTLVLAAALSLFRLPAPRDVLPMLELVVELTRIEPRADPEPAVPPVPVDPVEPLEPAETIVEPPPAAEPLPMPDPFAPVAPGEAGPADLETLREEAIREVLDAAEREASYTVNPPFDRALEDARVRFRASLAPEETHVWDNVEKDQLGRTILRDGNCWRVVDDPSVVNRWAYQNFDQFMVYCDFFIGGKGENLPWVEIIRERYPYLRDPVEIP